jgi:hypothetical protein
MGPAQRVCNRDRDGPPAFAPVNLLADLLLTDKCLKSLFSFLVRRRITPPRNFPPRSRQVLPAHVFIHLFPCREAQNLYEVTNCRLHAIPDLHPVQIIIVLWGKVFQFPENKSVPLVILDESS